MESIEFYQQKIADLQTEISELKEEKEQVLDLKKQNKQEMDNAEYTMQQKYKKAAIIESASKNCTFAGRLADKVRDRYGDSAQDELLQHFKYINTKTGQHIDKLTDEIEEKEASITYYEGLIETLEKEEV